MSAAQSIDQLPKELQGMAHRVKERDRIRAEQMALATVLHTVASIVSRQELIAQFSGEFVKLISNTGNHEPGQRGLYFQFGNHAFQVFIGDETLGAQEFEHGDLTERCCCGGVTEHDCIVIRKIEAGGI